MSGRRTFLALPLQVFAGEVQPFLDSLQARAREIKWNAADSLHLTLHFFGTSSEEEIPKIETLVAPIASQVKPFEIYLAGAGAFPSVSSPRVIWIGVEGHVEPLIDLQKKMSAQLSAAGFQVEARDFKPHVTIGRLRRDKKISNLQIILGKGLPQTRTQVIREAVLYESILRPEGSVYEILKTFPFCQK